MNAIHTLLRQVDDAGITLTPGMAEGVERGNPRMIAYVANLVALRGKRPAIEPREDGGPLEKDKTYTINENQKETVVGADGSTSTINDGKPATFTATQPGYVLPDYAKGDWQDSAQSFMKPGPWITLPPVKGTPDVNSSQAQMGTAPTKESLEPSAPKPEYVPKEKNAEGSQRTFKDGMIKDFTLPEGARTHPIVDEATGVTSTIWVPGNVDFQKVYDAGNQNKGSINKTEIFGYPLGSLDINDAVGHYGKFDYQRNEGKGKMDKNVFYPAFTNASNYAVGVYMAGAGYSWEDTYRIASQFARKNSSNADELDKTMKPMWEAGWKAGQKMKPTQESGAESRPANTPFSKHYIPMTGY